MGRFGGITNKLTTIGKDHFKGSIKIDKKITSTDILAVWASGENVDYYLVRVGNEVVRTRTNTEGVFFRRGCSAKTSASPLPPFLNAPRLVSDQRKPYANF